MKYYRRKNSLRRKLIYFFVTVVLLVILIDSSYKKAIISPIDNSDDTDISFQIKRGTTAGEIAENLEEKGLIDNAFYFNLYTKLNHIGENIIAGRFVLNKTMNIKEIAEKITNPINAEFVITVQEGLTVKDIDKKLVDLELIEEGEFIQEVKTFDGWEYYPFLDQSTLSTLDIPLEGYLYPDTYFLDPGDFEPHDLVFLMLDNFEKKFEDLSPQIKRHTYHEIVTMASIIEREVFGEEDRRLVSGILWKRLESGWTLGADATIIYITPDNKITSADLALESPYNTRKNLGLPPGPISNPSREAIEAAMFPTSSNYWFYLNTPDTGEVIYSNSNEEHNVNKAKYL